MNPRIVRRAVVFIRRKPNRSRKTGVVAAQTKIARVLVLAANQYLSVAGKRDVEVHAHFDLAARSPSCLKNGLSSSSVIREVNRIARCEFKPLE